MSDVDAIADAADGGGLAAALAGLSQLVSGTGTLELLLTRVANFVVVAIPGAEGAGVTIQELGDSPTIVASATFVTDVDDVQYRLGEGPCISAAASGMTTGSGALGDDLAWPRFGPLAAELGVHSAISFPLVVAEVVFGALNVYSHERDAFGEQARRIGELFAGPAAVAIHNAQILDQSKRTTARLEVALSTRSMIDHAVGIMMAGSGIAAEDAYIRLRMMSQQAGATMAVVAAQVVEEAAQHAADRNSSPEIPG